MSKPNYQTVFKLQGLTLKMVKPSFEYRFECGNLIRALDLFTDEYAAPERKKLEEIFPDALEIMKDLDPAELDLLDINPSKFSSKARVEKFNERLKKIAEKQKIDLTRITDAYIKYETQRAVGDEVFFADPVNIKKLFGIFFGPIQIKRVNFNPTGEDRIKEFDIAIDNILQSFFLSNQNLSRKSIMPNNALKNFRSPIMGMFQT